VPQLSLTERITESFTLARAQRAAETTPESVRRGVAEELALSRQKADAAESLFDNGHPAEAIKLSREALEQALSAVGHLDAITKDAPAAAKKSEARDSKASEGDSKASEGDSKASEGDSKASEGDSKASEGDSKASEGDSKASESDSKASEGDSKASEDDATASQSDAKASESAAKASESDATESWRRILAGRGAVPETLKAVAEVVTAMRAAAAPRLDAEVTADHAAAFHRILAARVAIDREVHPAALTVAQVGAKRRNRIALAVFVALVAIVGSYLALRRPTGTFADASAYFGNNDQFAPANAIDGNPETEWLLPDHTTGWLEVNVGPPRRIAAVSIVNASNQPHEDRATREYTIEVWAHGELARSVEGTLPFSTARNPVRHQVDVDDAERVRVVVRSWHQLGAGLAELSFE
jgi:hypothetical protein